MLLFIFMGKFVGISDPVYIVIGNILLLPSMNGLSGVSMTIGGERQFGTLSYLLGSPAPRGPIFLGRALFHILDGFYNRLDRPAPGAVDLSPGSGSGQLCLAAVLYLADRPHFQRDGLYPGQYLAGYP